MITDVITILKNNGVVFEKGLNADEIGKVEKVYEIKLPLVWKEFFKTALPVSRGFYNLRDFSNENVELIKSVMKRPFDDFKEKLESEKLPKQLYKEFEKAPKLFPIFSHRFIPSGDFDDPPVFSIMQTDIIVYGKDLYEWAQNEYRPKNTMFSVKEIKTKVPFWISVLDYSD